MSKFKVLLVFPNLMYQMQLPSNIPLLAACLKEKGYDVKLFDTTLYKTSDKNLGDLREKRIQVKKMDLSEGLKINKNNVFDDFFNIVKNYKPDLIGVSVVDSTIELAFKLINTIGCMNIPIVFGGKYAIFSPEELIEHFNIDIICIGEGEQTLVDLCDHLKNGTDYKNLENLWVKDRSLGKVYKNKLKAPVDLNDLPFEDFSVFEEQRLYSPMRGKMLKMLPINFDRGCPYPCTFCGAPFLLKLYHENGYKYYREKSIDRIYKELKYQVDKFRVDYLYFNSETFLSRSLDKLKKFEEMYSEFKIPFWCQTRIDTITDEKMEILVKMNCDRVAVSIEHGNEEFRKTVLKKHITNDQIVKGLGILNKYDVKIGINNIIGFPDETRELAFDTIELNRKLKFDSVNGFAFQPYRGTYLREYCLEKGYLKEGSLKDINSSIMGESFLHMPQFPENEIEGLLRTFVLYVCLPKEYYPKIKIAEQSTEEGDAMLEELKVVYNNLSPRRRNCE